MDEREYVKNSSGLWPVIAVAWASMAGESANACDIDELRGLFLFEGLTDDQLQRLCGNATVATLPAGLLCREGALATHFYVLLDGEIALSKRTGDRDIEMWTTSQRGAYCGAWSAFLPDDDVRYENHATLTRPSRMLVLDAATLGDFLRTEFPMATHLLVGHSRGRAHAGRILGPHERLVQLGQLTAGLTHELNNPAAAAVRAASALRSRIAETRQRRDGAGADTALIELHDRMAEVAAKPVDLTAAQKSHLEEALAEWLDAHGVTDAWEHAATFAEAGIDVDWMERISASASGATPAGLGAAIGALGATVETELLLNEIADATKRISVLVEQVKQYSQLDRAPYDVTDIHALLDSTLAMLSHRLVDGVTVQRDYEHGLPGVPCYAAELNQVWTNLINNALDAMPAGVLTLRTRRERDTARIEVCDTGPGIAEDVMPRIFDPFFTTKPFGAGAGLGLDIAMRIVDRHRGSLWAESAPGDTRFITTLPLTARL